MKYEILSNNLSDEEFIKNLCELAHTKDISFFEYLDKNKDIVERIIELKNDVLNKILESYYSYKYLIQVCNICDNPLSVSEVQRISILNDFSDNSQMIQVFEDEKRDMLTMLSTYNKKTKRLSKTKNYFKTEEEYYNEISIFSLIKNRLEKNNNTSLAALFVIGNLHLSNTKFSCILNEFILVFFREFFLGFKEQEKELLNKFNFKDINDFILVLKSLESNYCINTPHKSINKETSFYTIEYFRNLKKYCTGADGLKNMI